MKLSNFSILSTREQQLFADWNRTETDWERACVPALFERKAQERPEALACCDENGSLSFGELNRRANRLAHRLRAGGVKPEVRVALYIERSTELLVGLMGIFKAGGCVVPLDPQYPSGYLQRILADAQPRFIVTMSALEGDIAGAAVETVCVDDAKLAKEREENPSPLLRPEHLSHVMYTSGSTGQPKGVMVPQAQIVNWLHALWQRMPFSTDDVVAQKTSISFAVSVKELLAGLLAGAPQVLLADDTVKDAQAFVAALSRWRVTRLNIVPSHLQSLLSHIDSGDADGEALRSLRYCVTAGEPLTEALRAEVGAKLPWVTLWNNYGCTELNDVTYHEAAQAASGVFVPIGRPIANTRLYVLDSALRQVPIGVAGELCVESIGMARGYWDKPDLTAERFIPHPFSLRPGARLYRTGDMVRHLADGTLEYLGRHDFEIKIRGHRIDVRQVEKALKEHPAIAQAVVAAWPRNSTKAQLVAYMVKAAGELPAADAVRGYLAECLPAYMVPTLYVPLEALPRLPNGKLNRMGLPEPDAALIQTSVYAAPATEAERILCGIWQELLGLERVGVTDNFFSIGGDSISTAKVVAQARRLGLSFTTRQLFDHQTIRELAARLEAGAQQAVEGRQKPAPAHYRLPLEQGTASHPWLLMLAPPELNEAAMKQILQALMRRHDALRLKWTFENGQWQAAYRPMEQIAVDELLQAEEMPADVSRLAERCDALAMLPAGRGPMMKVILFTATDGSRQLLLVLHRLVADGAALDILAGDIESAWQQLRSGRTIRLPSKAASYQAWAEAFHRHAADEAVRDERAFWLRQLQAAEPAGPIRAVDQPGGSLRFQLSSAHTEAWLSDCAGAYHAGSADLLLAAISLGISRFSGIDHLSTAIEADGRGQGGADEFHQTVGCFTLMHPLALSGLAGLSVEEIIRGVKSQREHVPHGGLGYQALIGPLGDEALLEAEAKHEYDVAFRYLGACSGDALVGAAFSHAARCHAPPQARASLGIEAHVARGGLVISLHDHVGRFKPAELAALGEAIQAALRETIEHCHAKAAGADVPSGFSWPLAVEGSVHRYHPLPANRHWYFNGRSIDLHAWGSAVAFSLDRPGDYAETLGTAVALLRRLHPGLRLQLTHEQGRWYERVAAEDAVEAFRVDDLQALPEPQKEIEFDRRFGLYKSGVDLSDSLVNVIYVRMGQGRPDRIVVVTHHLAIDQYAFGILINELSEIFVALRDGKPMTPKRIDTSLEDWARAQKRWANSAAAGEVVDYWTRKDLSGFGRLPVDFEHGPQDNSIGSSLEAVRRLSVEETNDFFDFVKNTSAGNLLPVVLAGVTEGFARWTGKRALCIEIVDSGRDAWAEEVDLTSTIGWVNEFVPVFVDLEGIPQGQPILQAASRAAEECMTYGKRLTALKCHVADPAVAQAMFAIMEPEVAINILPPGLEQGTLPADEGRPLSFLRWEGMDGARRERVHLLGCEVGFAGGKMYFSWNYSRNVFYPATIERMADYCMLELKALIASAAEREAA